MLIIDKTMAQMRFPTTSAYPPHPQDMVSDSSPCRWDDAQTRQRRIPQRV